MGISYDLFIDAFLSKISEFEFAELESLDRETIVVGYMRRAIAAFKKNCKYDLTSAMDDDLSMFDIEINDEDLDELVEIISEGMVLQWLKPYLNKQELLENAMNTRDYTLYSSANQLRYVGVAYDRIKKDYTQMIREYSYNHGDLTKLHL